MTSENEKADEVVCLACGVRYPAKSMTRGLCPADYQQFIRVKSKALPHELPKLEAKLIAQGKLLPDGRATDNPFAAALAEVREEEADYTAEQIADEVFKNDAPKANPATNARKKKGM